MKNNNDYFKHCRIKKPITEQEINDTFLNEEWQDNVVDACIYYIDKVKETNFDKIQQIFDTIIQYNLTKALRELVLSTYEDLPAEIDWQNVTLNNAYTELDSIFSQVFLLKENEQFDKAILIKITLGINSPIAKKLTMWCNNLNKKYSNIISTIKQTSKNKFTLKIKPIF